MNRRHQQNLEGKGDGERADGVKVSHDLKVQYKHTVRSKLA